MSLINDALKRARQAQRQHTATPDAAVTGVAASPLQPVDDPQPRSGSKLVIITPALLLLIAVTSWLTWRRSSAPGTTTPIRVAAREGHIPATEVAGANPVSKATETMAKWAARTESQEVAASSFTQQPTINPQPKLAETPQPDKVPASTATLQASTPTTSASISTTPTGNLALAAATPNAPVVTRIVTPPQASPALPTAPASAPVLSNAQSSQSTPAAQIAPPPGGPSASPSTAAPITPSAVTISQPNTLVTAAPQSTISPMPNLKLQGIFYRLKHPTALINGRIVAVADEIEGYRVVQIERHGVRLMVPGHTNVVALR